MSISVCQSPDHLDATNGNLTSLKMNSNEIKTNFVHCRSTDAEDVVALEPVVTDFDNMCGSRLEFKVRTNKLIKLVWLWIQYFCLE